MKKQSSKSPGARAAFTGTVAKHGVHVGKRGLKKSVLLSNVRGAGNAEAETLPCGIWVNLTNELERLDLQEGDIIQFDAKLRAYPKDYALYGCYEHGAYDSVDGAETEWELDRPTNVKIIGMGRT